MNEIEFYFSESEFNIFRKFCAENNITKARHLTKNMINQISFYRGIGENKLQKIKKRLNEILTPSLENPEKFNKLLDLKRRSNSLASITYKDTAVIKEFYNLFDSILDNLGPSKSLKSHTYMDFFYNKKKFSETSNTPGDILNLKISSLFPKENFTAWENQLWDMKVKKFLSLSSEDFIKRNISTFSIAQIEKILYKVSDLKEVIEEILSALNEGQMKLLELRFKKKYTLDRCGKIIGVSRERARQIESMALKKLLEKNKISELIFNINVRTGFSKSITCEKMENLLQNKLLLEILKTLHLDKMHYNSNLDLFIFENFEKFKEIEKSISSLPDTFRIEEYFWEISDYLSVIDAFEWDDLYFEKCLGSFHFKRYGEFFTKRKESDSLFIETYFEKIAEEPFRLDRDTFGRFNYEIDKYFNYKIKGNLRSVYGFLDRYKYIIKTAPLTYTHVSKVSYDYDTLCRVKSSLRKLKRPYISLEEAFSLNRKDLASAGIHTAYTFYYLLKYEFEDEFKVGSGNSMNLYFDHETASKTREELIYDALWKIGHPMDKAGFCNHLGIKDYCLNDTIFKSEKFLFFDKSLVGLVDWVNVFPWEEKKIIEIARNKLENHGYALVYEIADDIISCKDLQEFRGRNNYLNRYFISWFLKRICKDIYGNFNILYLESSPIKNASDLVLNKIGTSVVRRSDIAEICDRYNFKDATRSNMSSKLFEDNKIVEIDFDKIILRENLKLEQEIIIKIEDIFLSLMKDSDFISLNRFTTKDLETLLKDIPLPKAYRWNIYLIKSILKLGSRLRLLLKQNSDYRYDNLIFIKSELKYNILEELIFELIRKNIPLPAEEKAAYEFLENLDILSKKKSSFNKKLPFGMSRYFLRDSLGNIRVK